MDDSGTSRALAQLRTAVAAAGVVVAIAYLTGAGVLVLQMLLEDLPPGDFIGALPRESAVASGVSLVIGPAVLWGVLYALLRFTFRSGWAPPGTHRRWNKYASESVKRRRIMRGAWLVEFVAGVGLLSAPGVWHATRRYHWWSHDWRWAALIIVAVMVPTMLGYMHGRARVAESWPRGRKAPWWMPWRRLSESESDQDAPDDRPWTYPLRGAGRHAGVPRDRYWSRPVPVVVGAALAAAAAVPAAAAYWAVVKLPDAMVCLRAVDGTYPDPIKGVLVGQTADRVYLGDPEPSANERRPPPRALTTLSADVVDRVVVRGANPSQCHIPPPKAAEAAQSGLSTGAINQLLATQDRLWRGRHAAHLRAWERHQRAARALTP